MVGLFKKIWGLAKLKWYLEGSSGMVRGFKIPQSKNKEPNDSKLEVNYVS